MPNKNKKVILVYPSRDSGLSYKGADFDYDGYHCIPPGLLSMATVIRHAGYTPVVIDCRLYPKKESERMLLSELEGALAVGISAMTCQVIHGLYLSKLVKDSCSVPVVWGGIHPTLFPESTAEDPLVDYVMFGEAESSFIKLLSFISENAIGLESVPGLAWKNGGRIVKNAPDEIIDINKLPLPEYELLDIEKYIERRLIHGERVRGLDIMTSRGCPYRCAFCTNTFLLGRKWRPLSTEKIFTLMDALIQRHNLNNFMFVDDFFFGEKQRALEISGYLTKRHKDISWEADIRADNFKAGFVDSNYLDGIRRGGCHSLRIGAESGSNRVLEMLKKEIDVGQTKTAVKKCLEHGIRPILFFMIGIPGESQQEALETARFIISLKEEFPKVRIFGPAVFRPYPGSELYEELVKGGFITPLSLREWGKDSQGGYLETKKLPWLKDRATFISDLIFYIDMSMAYKGQHPSAGLRKVFGLIALMRNRINFWRFRIDARAVSLYKSLKESLFSRANNENNFNL